MSANIRCVTIVIVLLGWGNQLAVSADTDLAMQAEVILRKHCYECHGYKGSIEGGMNYVLSAQRLTARGKIVPGKPSESLLFERIEAKEMPPEDIETRLTDAEIEIIKNWIEAGTEASRPVIQRAFITEDDVVKFIHDDLEATPARQRPYIRYLTVTNLHNQQLSGDELQTYRRGLSKLLNSLSWNSRIVIFKPIDRAKTVLRIDLRDYNWTTATWNSILDRYPYGVRHDSELAERIYEWSECELPSIRADWFVALASRPPLYHEILDLPMTDAELEQQLRIRVLDKIEQDRVVRAAFNGSGVSRNNRMIERHESPYGAYWKSYDFAGNRGRQNLFAYPLGPDQDNAFKHAGGEILFNLPNGMQAYMLVDENGNRIDKGPTEIVSDPKRPDLAVENGLSCMSCHGTGVIDKQDQIRPHAEANPNAFSKTDHDTILALYAPRDEFLKLVEQDTARFRDAVKKTGGNTGTEPIVALAQRFEEELDLAAAACEAGISPKDLVAGMKNSSQLARKLGVLKVAGGTVQREVYVELFRDIVDELNLGTCLDHRGEIRRFEGHTDRVPKVAFSPDGRYLLSASDDKNIRLWDLQTSEEVGEFEEHTDLVRCVAFSPDGKWFVSGTNDGIIRVWKTDTRKMERELTGHKNRVFCVSFDPTSNRVLYSSGMDGTIRQWDVQSGEAVHTFWGHRSWVRSVAVAEDGSRIMSGGNHASFVVWDTESRQPVTQKGIAHKAPLTTVVFVPKSRRAATAGFDNMIRLWDPASARKILEYSGHTKPVRDMVVSPDGLGIVSVGDDKTMRFWLVESGEQIHQVESEGGFSSIAMSPDGRRVATGGYDGTVSLWGVPVWATEDETRSQNKR